MKNLIQRSQANYEFMLSFGGRGVDKDKSAITLLGRTFEAMSTSAPNRDEEIEDTDETIVEEDVFDSIMYGKVTGVRMTFDPEHTQRNNLLFTTVGTFTKFSSDLTWSHENHPGKWFYFTFYP